MIERFNMKIIGLTGTQFAVAVIVALSLCFAFIAFTSPHPVEQPKIVLTPVPTPQPVYVKPTQTFAPTAEDIANMNVSEIMGLVIPLFSLGVLLFAVSFILHIIMTVSKRFD